MFFFFMFIFVFFISFGLLLRSMGILSEVIVVRVEGFVFRAVL